MSAPLDLSNSMSAPPDLSNLMSAPPDLSNLMSAHLDLSNSMSAPLDLSNLMSAPPDSSTPMSAQPDSSTPMSAQPDSSTPMSSPPDSSTPMSAQPDSSTPMYRTSSSVDTFETVENSRINSLSRALVTFRSNISVPTCSCGVTNCFKLCDGHILLSKAKHDNSIKSLVKDLAEHYLFLGELYSIGSSLTIFEPGIIFVACCLFGSLPNAHDSVIFWFRCWRSIGHIRMRHDYVSNTSSSKKVMNSNHFNLKLKSCLPESFGSKLKLLFNAIVQPRELINLELSLNCFGEAKALLSMHMGDRSSFLLEIGNSFSIIARKFYADTEMDQAENCCKEAITAHTEALDYSNVMDLYLLMGSERDKYRIWLLRTFALLGLVGFASWNEFIEAVRPHYEASLKFYGLARTTMEMVGCTEEKKYQVDHVLAHTWLDMGKLLAKGDNTVYKGGKLNIFNDSQVLNTKFSADDAYRESVLRYNILGESYKDQLAEAYYILSGYQTTRWLTLVDSGHSVAQSGFKEYGLFAVESCNKALEYYRPAAFPTEYMTCVMNRTKLFLKLYTQLNDDKVLEMALVGMLEGREVDEKTISSGDFVKPYLKLLQEVTKEMLKKERESEKLRGLFLMALKATSLSVLDDMQQSWTDCK